MPPPDMPDVGGKFQQTPFKDVWASVLFFVHLVGFVILAATTLPRIGELNQTGTPQQPDPISNIDTAEIVTTLVTAIFSGLLLSSAYFMLLQKYTGSMIKISFFFSVASTILMGIYYMILGQTLAGVLMLLFGGLFAFCYYSWRQRIPFAKILIRTVCDITARYKGTLVAAALGLVMQTVWALLWSVAFMVALQVNRDSTARGLITVFCLFSFYWVSRFSAYLLICI